VVGYWRVCFVINSLLLIPLERLEWNRHIRGRASSSNRSQILSLSLSLSLSFALSLSPADDFNSDR